jgi:hypothetical protein
VAWVTAGGTAIVTGASGTFAGETSNFATLSQYSLSALTGVTDNTTTAPVMKAIGQGKVLYIPTNIGMSYWQAFANRTTLLPTYQQQLASVLPTTQVLLSPYPSSIINLTK